MALHPRTRRRGGWIDVFIVLLFTTIILSAFFFAAFKVYFEKMAGVPYGVYYLGYDLGGLSSAEAQSVVDNVSQAVFSQPIYLKFNENTWVLRYPKHFKFDASPAAVALKAVNIGKEERGVQDHLRHLVFLDYPRVDLPVEFKLDRAFTQAHLTGALTTVLVNRIYAKPRPDGKVELRYMEGDLALDDVLTKIDHSVRQSPITTRRVVNLEKRSSQGTTKVVSLDDPESGFTIPLTQKKMTLSKVDPLTYEMLTEAVKRIDKTILNPGDTFNLKSAFRAFPRDVDSNQVTGYSYLASALYQAALEVGAKIVERYRHPYFHPELAAIVGPGLDAALGPDKGLRFTNDQTMPMLLLAKLQSGVLELEIRSLQELPMMIRLHTGRVNKKPYETRWIESPRIPEGQEVVTTAGLEAIDIKVYRTQVSRAEGRVISQEVIAEDTYLGRDAVVQVPMGFKPPPPPSPPPPEETEETAEATTPDAVSGEGDGTADEPAEEPTSSPAESEAASEPSYEDTIRNGDSEAYEEEAARESEDEGDERSSRSERQEMLQRELERGRRLREQRGN